MKVLIIGGFGYLGSAICKHLSGKGYFVRVVDTGWFGKHNLVYSDQYLMQDYNNLTEGFLGGFDSVILTAAHSSVGLCEWDSYGAFKNNVANFVGLLSKLKHQKFIYAGSSCVYKDTGSRLATEEDMSFQPIDNLTLTKTIIDYYAQRSDVECYGLRLGSVNGDSPNFRGDLMVNGMTTSAINQGVVRVANPLKHRPILGTKDLVRAVEVILQRSEDLRGIYNVSSYNSTVAMIAFDVARLTGSPIESQPDTPTYDFSIDTSKFRAAFNWEPLETTETIVRGILDNTSYRRATYRNILPGEEKYGIPED